MRNLETKPKTKNKNLMSSGPLSISLNLNSIKTSVPVISDGHNCRCRLVNITQAEGDKGASLKFEYHLLDPAPTTDGGQVKPGFPLFENVTLYDKNTPTGQIPEWASQKIAKRIDGFLGTGDKENKKGKPERPDLNSETVAAMVGKEAFIKVKAKTGEYEGNDIVSVTFPGDLQA